ncbi:MAG TPA: ABC transporter ATP-binding protein [Stellaceae bacterium]|nr:ABC transporter ATP-binding protein [Stellaceae bacterium]
MSEPALDVVSLSRSFGGVRACDKVSFAVPHGSLTAVIGPNGAGKTTVFNLVTNLYAADDGAVRFYGIPILGRAPAEIAAMGLIRTFQSARIYPGMTARENVLAGAHLHIRRPAWQQMLWLPGTRREEGRIAAQADALLDLVGLGPFRDQAATDLPMGGQKLLEVVRALMARPRLLLLDEPAAGLNDAETADLAALLRAVRDSGITVMVVEHNMSLVMGVADEVIVLDAGSIVAHGTPREIQNDARVIAAYVGQEAP